MKQMWQDFKIFVQTPALLETYLKTHFAIGSVKLKYFRTG